MKAQMWEIAGYTDKGPVKEINQDSFLFRTACSARGWAAILGVADGISGLGRGETASRKMMENLLNWWEDNVLRSQTERGAWPRTLETMLLETNRELIRWGKENGVQTGTTASILLLENGNYHILHVGDSRIYLAPGRGRKGLELLTEDQVKPVRREQGGRIYYKNVLTDCVGYREKFAIFQREGKVKKNDVYLVCSDGAYKKLKEDELVRFRRENVGFIFQSFHLLGTMNALENVALPLTFRGEDPKARIRKADKMLDMVGLKKHKKHLPSQMSGGQQQRVGVARALVSDPKIIFADEPTGNLDSHTSEEVMELMQKVVREQKRTLVMVTHDDHLAQYADRIFHIIDGKIVKIEDNRKQKEREEKGYEVV